jgi:hypothetical protein
MNPIEKKIKEEQLFITDKQKICKLAKKARNFNLKNIIDKIHKKLKLNIDHHIKTNKTHNIFKFNNV